MSDTVGDLLVNIQIENSTRVEEDPDDEDGLQSGDGAEGADVVPNPSSWVEAKSSSWIEANSSSSMWRYRDDLLAELSAEQTGTMMGRMNHR